MRWTDADRADAIRLRADGYSFQEVAVHFGVSIFAVQKQLKRVGYKTSMEWTDEALAELRQMIRRRQTAAEIAAWFGCTKAAAKQQRWLMVRAAKRVAVGAT